MCNRFWYRAEDVDDLKAILGDIEIDRDYLRPTYNAAPSQTPAKESE